jgi:hypothetical protein
VKSVPPVNNWRYPIGDPFSEITGKTRASEADDQLAVRLDRLTEMSLSVNGILWPWHVEKTSIQTLK